jgi:hypothetical protein
LEAIQATEEAALAAEEAAAAAEDAVATAMFGGRDDDMFRDSGDEETFKGKCCRTGLIHIRMGSRLWGHSLRR